MYLPTILKAIEAKSMQIILKSCTEVAVVYELPFQEFIKVLNWLNDVSFLKWSGSSFQVFEAKYTNELNSYWVKVG